MSNWEFPFMRKAGLLLAEVVQIVLDEVGPGVTTRDLDAIAEAEIKKRGATPAFKGYMTPVSNGPFPATICASKNCQVVHGFPDDVPLVEGDSISLDFGLVYQGYYSDMAVTKAVGQVRPEVQRLIAATSLALEEAIKQAVPGNRIGDIGSRVQAIAKQAGAGLVYEFVGHGIGRRLHERPAIPNFGHAGRGQILKPGMAICIEPMLTLGRGDTTVLDDGWTAVTKDRSIAAHFEHTVLITKTGPEVLTRLAA